jgi:Asp/Glu/hydantoin racemase
MKIPIAIIHATRASLEPVGRVYEAAPEFDIYHQLDDGLMRQLDRVEMPPVEARFREMITLARERYGVKLALLTCSAVPAGVMNSVRAWAHPFPVLKIDEPMAEAALAAAKRIGIIATFPATRATTRALLDGAIVTDSVIPEALQALFQGDKALHDKLLIEAARQQAAQGAQAIVLAQVSMAHLTEPIARETGLPVFNSLETSLAKIRSLLLDHAC